MFSPYIKKQNAHQGSWMKDNRCQIQHSLFHDTKGTFQQINSIYLIVSQQWRNPGTKHNVEA